MSGMREILHTKGRDNITKITGQLRTAIGRSVLLMPSWGLERTLANPLAPPSLHRRTDREGNRLPLAPTAFDIAHDTAIFDAAAILSLALTLDKQGGAHVAQLPDNKHFVDLMSQDPDKLHGTGHVLLVDGGGWVGENVDLTLGAPNRYIMTSELQSRGGPTVLGIGSLTLDDLALPVRREAHPERVHFQSPQPIPFA
jgi:hypothetical protein